MDIFIFDDHEFLREGLVSGLSREGYTIAGQAGNLCKAKELIEKYVPVSGEVCLAIVDLYFMSTTENLETAQGFDLVKYINSLNKNIQCIIFSSYYGTSYIRTAMSPAVGAKGYVSKTSESDELIKAIECVGKGQSYLDPKLGSMMITTDDYYDTLSKKEKEVLMYVQKEYSTAYIAEQLNISLRTVENHLSTIYAKTGCENKTELVNKFGRLSR